jgi:predicted metalloprotease
MLLVITVVTGCTSGKSRQPASPSSEAASVAVLGDTSSPFDRSIKNAVADVEAFWRKNYPKVSGGKAYPELKGKIYSVDGDRLTAADKENACLRQDPKAAVSNAFYCLADDSLVYDRNPEHLVAQLGAKYGQFIIAGVIAHEWGHAIQQRLGIFGGGSDRPTIYTETQADCASGAFIAAALNHQTTYVTASQADLERTLLGYLQVRDPPPVSAEQISHGNGFDRLSAMADGVAKSATYCFGNSFFSRSFTERPFTSDADYLRHGNLPYSQLVNAAPQNGTDTLQSTLNSYWTAAARSISKGWKSVSQRQAAHPACQPSGPSEFNYCSTQNMVYFDDAFARQSYNSLPDKRIDQSSGQVQLVDNAPADYALGTLFVYGWGMAVRAQLFNASTNDKAALLAASCYSGAFTSSINSDNVPTGFQLSPPDMDEATAAVIKLIPLDQAYGPRGSTALDRIQAFTTGYFGGLAAC